MDPQTLRKILKEELKNFATKVDIQIIKEELKAIEDRINKKITSTVEASEERIKDKIEVEIKDVIEFSALKMRVGKLERKVFPN